MVTLLITFPEDGNDEFGGVIEPKQQSRVSLQRKDKEAPDHLRFENVFTKRLYDWWTSFRQPRYFSPIGTYYHVIHRSQ